MKTTTLLMATLLHAICRWQSINAQQTAEGKGVNQWWNDQTVGTSAHRLAILECLTRQKP